MTLRILVTSLNSACGVWFSLSMHTSPLDLHHRILPSCCIHYLVGHSGHSPRALAKALVGLLILPGALLTVPLGPLSLIGVSCGVWG